MINFFDKIISRIHLFNFEEIEKKQLIPLIPSFLIVVGLFVSFIVFSIVGRTDKTLKYESEIDMKVTKVRSYKGFLTLNDSITVSGATPLLKEISKMAILKMLKTSDLENYNKFKMNFGQLVKPYRIVKESHTDTILIYQATDTLYFKLFTD